MLAQLKTPHGDKVEKQVSQMTSLRSKRNRALQQKPQVLNGIAGTVQFELQRKREVSRHSAHVGVTGVRSFHKE